MSASDAVVQAELNPESPSRNSSSGSVDGESSWSRLRRLLQRISELEAEVLESVAEKTVLERRNGELAARVEAWVSTHTDAVILSRGEFLDLEGARHILLQAHERSAKGQAEVQAELGQAMEWHGLLLGELDGLQARLHATKAERVNADRGSLELQTVAARLEKQLDSLDKERGRLVQEREQRRVSAEQQKLQQRLQQRLQIEAAVAAAEAAEAAAAVAVAEEKPTPSAEEPVVAAEAAPTHVVDGKLADVAQFCRAADDASSEASSDIGDVEALRRAVAAAVAERQQLSAVRDAALSAQHAAAEEALAASTLADVAVEGGRLSREKLEEERSAWEAERTGFISELANVRLEAQRQRQAATASLGQLVLERHELQERLLTKSGEALPEASSDNSPDSKLQ